jgi:hypothetical protein
MIYPEYEEYIDQYTAVALQRSTIVSFLRRFHTMKELNFINSSSINLVFAFVAEPVHYLGIVAVFTPKAILSNMHSFPVYR